MKKLTLLSIAFFAMFAANGQTLQPMMSVKTEYKPFISGLATDTSLFVTNLQVGLIDTTTVSKVHVKMGTTKGSGNLIEKDFTYDEAGTFVDGTSYSRVGKKISLGLGNFSKMEHFYGEVYVINTDESHSNLISFGR